MSGKLMPENSNFPYRRYDRLPPIHQYSIESDTDLSETAELIEEYEVFDPTRPRPKIILVIDESCVSHCTWCVAVVEAWLPGRQEFTPKPGPPDMWNKMPVAGASSKAASCCLLPFRCAICTPDLVVFLACANQRLKERLLKRAEQQGRPDDNLKATQRRLMNFKQNAAPLVKYFQEKGLIMTKSFYLKYVASVGYRSNENNW
ncbi:hypothetical protein CB1_000940011 [Camelus ferus]|nr:hypothetical protein CB1_000940011 [Camelus ferus]